MAQPTVSDFIVTPASNTDYNSVGILGTSLLSTADDAFRTLASMLKSGVQTGYTTTATAAGTTVLTANSNSFQYFTGATTQTITMPVTSTLETGRTFTFVNNSTGALTINSSGGNLIATVAAGLFVSVQCILLTGTTAASWNVLSTSNIGTGTGTSLALGTSTLAIGGNLDALEVLGTTAATGGQALAMFNATAGTGAHLDFYRSKNATLGSATVVANGDAIALINGYGAQQTGTFATQTMAAQIRFEVDGVVTSGGSGDMPGRIVLATTADGGSAVTDRWTIKSNGDLVPGGDGTQVIGSAAKQVGYIYLADSAQVRWKDTYYITVAGTGMTFNAASSYYFDGLINLDPAGATGGRIQFPATQNASANANTLDDYEEGTWVPVIEGTSTAGTGTYSTQSGVYTKIGRMVTAAASLTWTGHTGTGNLQISGFPFATAAITYSTPVLANGLTVTGQPFVTLSGTTAAIFAQSNGTLSSIAMDTAVTTFNFTLVYFAAT